MTLALVRNNREQVRFTEMVTRISYGRRSLPSLWEEMN